MGGEQAAGVGLRRAFEAADAVAGDAALVVFRGRRGAGKTTLLGDIRRIWHDRGICVVPVQRVEDGPKWDEFGAWAVVDGFRKVLPRIADPRVTRSMAAVGRLCVPHAYTASPAHAALAAELARLFSALRATGRAALLVDDAHLLRDPGLLTAAVQAGCTVVATCHEDRDAPAPAPLLGTANRLFDLLPLTDEDIGSLLATAATEPVDESVAGVLRVALGPAVCTPATVIRTFGTLREQNRFAAVLGRLCLADPAAPIALPPGHELLEHVARFGDVGRQLVAVVAGAARYEMDDLVTFAEATNTDLDRCGEAVDGMVAAGALLSDADGVLTVSGPALATAVLEDLGPKPVAALHAAIARQLNAGEHPPPSERVAAEHASLAGAALPPSPGSATTLITAADRVMRADPALSARWYRAALRHLLPGAERDRVLHAVLHLLVHAGDYRSLREVVAESVAEGVDRPCYALAASAALAAIHTGQPVPAVVADALSADPACRGPLTVTERWFAGLPVPGEELVAAFSPFRTGCPLDVEHGTLSPVAATGEDLDVVALFKLALGAEYGEPVCGPIALYTRLRHGYLGDSWSRIPSLARQLELAGSTRTALHRVARLLTAEVLSWLGESASAREIAGIGGAECPYPALRAWAEVGDLYRSGDYDQARARGWAAYEEIKKTAGGIGRVGVHWFLNRLVYLEQSAQDGVRLHTLHTEIRWWRARYGGTGLDISELMTRALAGHDHDSAVRAVALVRNTGPLIDLKRACLIAGFTAEDAEPWFHEAYGIAKKLGGDRMHLNVMRWLDDRGVAAPRSRVGGETFTAGERRLIALVRQGLTNRQIGGALGVSEKAAESQLSRLFAKTGCRSRVDLARASHEGRIAHAVA
ncbi:helix-turn-helix transcriptional regulator [Amycolatopsis sp. lyj-346]|uniref:helix-turn-helix transcriptional regulator n=1 Tax=Amycolatopsis sp. lyj-346 TaxID=2789289 RepID=UPI003979E1E0